MCLFQLAAIQERDLPSLKTRLQKVTEEIQKLRDVIEEVRDFNPVCNNDNKDPPLKGGGGVGAENALQCLAIDICVCCFDTLIGLRVVVALTVMY